ncbi:translation initiation/elongation factor MRX8 [Aspergillus ruber CBS 135680]|uniref:GTP-binding protein 8 n=1 Tax=Aspergillus ruber (strain CBS 135680) TaxID=1388766 RepID=A0A017S2I1_ASPRC|nr:putative GTP binding protein [Aspergillus ruber CBS 135680]EYE91026.1 putative GTP binding protein [Aspergillus ruber CBS 135680]
MRPRNYICATCLRKRTPYISHRTVATTSTPSTVNPSNPNLFPFHALTPSQISCYWDTRIPNDHQLAYANSLFTPSRHSPIKLWSANRFRTMPMSSLEPEVAFLGRSNVGKSSLLNAIMGKEICWTSSKPGRTREMNAFGIGGTKGGENKIVLLDMPGYGKGSRTGWGVEIMKYLQGRRQLRRAFVLIDSDHGLKQTDHDILALFRRYAIPHQVVISKVDKLLKSKSGASVASLAALQDRLQNLRPVVQPDGRFEGPGALGEILTCSTEPRTRVAPGHGQFLGISALRWAILSAAGYGGSVEVKEDHVVSSESSGSKVPDFQF